MSKTYIIVTSKAFGGKLLCLYKCFIGVGLPLSCSVQRGHLTAIQLPCCAAQKCLSIVACSLFLNEQLTWTLKSLIHFFIVNVEVYLIRMAKQEAGGMGVFFTTLMESAREKHRITFRKLGQLLGCAPSYLSEIENGRRPIPKDTAFLSKLADVLQLDPSEVIGAANNERDARNPRRLRDLFKEDRELAACYFRLSEAEVSDAQLKQALIKAMSDLGMVNDD